MISGGFYNILAIFSFPELPFGWYYFAIYDPVAGETKATSSEIYVEEEEIASINTAMVSFRNETDLHGFRYEANPDFWNRVRLPLIQLGPTRPVADRKQYRNVSNRRLRNWFIQKDKIATIETYFVSEEVHDAIDAIYDHDNLFLNRSFVTAKEAYNIQERQQSYLTKASIDVVIDESVEIPETLLEMVSFFNPDEFSDEFD
jgi:hypothetical protein